MRSVLVSSTELYAGKSAICMALGLILKEKGLSVGYMKPVGNLVVDLGGELVDDDAVTMKKMLGLKERPEELSPILFTDHLLENVLAGRDDQPVSKLKEAFARVSKGKDVMILESAGGVSGSAVLGLSDADLARITGSRILLVSKFSDEFTVDRILTYLKLAGGAEILGIVFNNTVAESMGFVRDKVVPFFERRGVPVLGVLPENRALETISAREIAAGLGGQVLAGKDHQDVTVEGIVVGAMAPDSAVKVFRRKPSRALITGGDRSDLQLAGLEARLPVLVLTGNLYPAGPVLGRAEEIGVPVILVSDDTITTVDRMETLMRQVRVKNMRKADMMKGMLDEYVDMDKIVRALGKMEASHPY